MQRRTCQVILFLADGQLGLAHPFGGLLFILFLLFLQQVLVGDGNRHLSLHL